VFGRILVIPQVGGLKDFKLEEKLSLNALSIRLADNRVFEYSDLFDEKYIHNCKLFSELQQYLIDLKFIDLSILIDLFDADKEDSIKVIYSKYNNYINKYELTPSTIQIEFALLCKSLLNK
jgi:hypothetical protein